MLRYVTICIYHILISRCLNIVKPFLASILTVCIILIPCCELSKSTVIQLNLQCTILVIVSRHTPCYFFKPNVFQIYKLPKGKYLGAAIWMGCTSLVILNGLLVFKTKISKPIGFFGSNVSCGITLAMSLWTNISEQISFGQAGANYCMNKTLPNCSIYYFIASEPTSKKYLQGSTTKYCLGATLQFQSNTHFSNWPTWQSANRPTWFLLTPTNMKHSRSHNLPCIVCVVYYDIDICTTMNHDFQALSQVLYLLPAS